MIHFFAAAAERVKPESTGVAETVEHFFALGEFADTASGVALVEVVARLVTVLHVDGEQNAVFVDDDRFVRNFSKNNARAEGETFFFADFGITAFVNAAAFRLFGQQFVNGFTVDFGTGRENFDRVNIGVFVDNATRNAVVFGVHEAECAFLVVDVESTALAGGYCAVENIAKEFSVDFCILAFVSESPEAATDLGFGGIRCKAKKIALVAVNFNNITELWVTDNFVDGTTKNPRMVAEGRFIAPGF